MGCSTCGGGKQVRTPGGTARLPILLGEVDGRPAQVATFLSEYEGNPEGAYRYVAGDGVEAAVADGLIALGYVPSKPTSGGRTLVEKPHDTPPEFYVRIGSNRWLGFKTRPAAERYASIRDGAEVLTRDEVMNA